MLDLQRNRLVCASPRTWNTKPISRNTRLDTSGHTRKKIIKQRQWRQQREKKIHRIAKMRGKKISKSQIILWYIRRLDRFLNNCVHVNFSLDYSIQLIFNFRFPILNWLLGWRNKTLKNARKMSDILLCPFPVVVCAWKLHADESRWNIFLVLFFHYFVIHFSWDWFLLERRFTRITDCSITRLSI